MKTAPWIVMAVYLYGSVQVIHLYWTDSTVISDKDCLRLGLVLNTQALDRCNDNTMLDWNSGAFNKQTSINIVPFTNVSV